MVVPMLEQSEHGDPLLEHAENKVYALLEHARAQH